MRIDAECAVLAHSETRVEGSVSVRGQDWKSTVVYGVNRTIDEPALASVRDGVPPLIFDQVIKYKPVLDLAGLRYIQNNEPEYYAVFAQAITAKPAKPSVRVEMIAEERRAA